MVSIFGNARFMVCIAPGGGAAVHAYIPFAFQFHYGSIRTHQNRKSLYLFLEFQFHYGAIRTLPTTGTTL